MSRASAISEFSQSSAESAALAAALGSALAGLSFDVASATPSAVLAEKRILEGAVALSPSWTGKLTT